MYRQGLPNCFVTAMKVSCVARYARKPILSISARNWVVPVEWRLAIKSVSKLWRGRFIGD